MSNHSLETNRLLHQLDHTMRQVNKDTLNPAIPELTIDGIQPTLQMVANVRAQYLKKMMILAKRSAGRLPSQEEIASLRKTRECYDELVHGIQALEAAIKRGYLDVEQPQQAA